MWDATAIQVTTKAIGQVESGMAYDAVNPSDPITVGFFQWYGTRAAAILDRMRDENPTSWTGVASSLASSLTTYSSASGTWTSRYLTQTEINSIRPVLLANTGIQDDQAAQDIADYKSTAVAQGMNADSNTDAVSFFCVMYHQQPRAALRVLANVGASASLDRIYAACLNDSVLGQYRTRYTTAYNLIKSHDTSGVGTGTPGGTTPTPGNPGSSRPVTDIKYLRQVGGSLHIKFKDHHTLTCVPNGTGMWIPSSDGTLGADVPPEPSGTPPTGVQAQMRQWLIDHQNAYAYGQGASRLTPDQNGYTDCSGLMYWVYKTIANLYIGTYTGNQISHGTLITTSPATAIAETSLAIGDLVFYRWSANSPSTYDHVAMYIGANEIESHGGPDNGPDRQSHSAEINYAINGGGSIMVRRYV